MPVYKIPSDVETTRLRTQAARRRTALTNAGCATYTLGLARGQAAIVCLCCGQGSHHFKDVQERYCGFCHAWHSEEQEAT